MPTKPLTPLLDIAAQTVLDSLSEGVFTVDTGWQITSMNRAASEITGVPRDEALGLRCSDVFRASACEQDCPVRRAQETGVPVSNMEISIFNADGERVSVSVNTSVLRDENGNVIGGIESFRDLTQVEQLRSDLDGRSRMGEIISRDPAMQRLFDIMPALAESESTVLIEGESGTGKELVARAIHALSPRGDQPMVTVNCGAMPDALLESELFGHVAGAFTDARYDRQGRFAEADGGTLFLDEIADVSPALQVRLLRVLQEGTFEPLGSNETREVNVRLIAATNRSLSELVREGTFRQDLYYRVNVVRLELPPLRDRHDDIPLLVEHFIQEFNERRGRDLTGVSPDVCRMLSGYAFPGNIRELENTIERAFVLCRSGQIGVEHLPDEIRQETTEDSDDDPKHRYNQAEAEFLLGVLRRHGGHRANAASELGIHPTTLWRKMKKLGISPPVEDGRSSLSARGLQ
jgi:PAS domain S-box-containing protein